MSKVRSKVLDDVRKLVANGGLPPETVLSALVDGLMDIDDELKGSRDAYDKDVLENTRPVLRYLKKVEGRVERWMRGELREL